jgi:ATP-dependent Clp protease adapter protein ClpS
MAVDSKEKKITGVSIFKDQYDYMQVWCANHDMTFSKVVRDLLQTFIAGHQDEVSTC